MRFVDKLRRPALGLVLILAMTGCGESGDAGDREPGGTGSVKTESGTPESDEAEDGTAENGLAKSDEAEDGPAESGMQQDTETESSETEGSEVKREIVTIQDKAYESFSSFIDAYYFKSRITEGVGSFIGSNIFFWEPAEMYEMVIDAYEHTGDERYYRMIREIFEGFKLEHGEDWAWNEYNDDIAWMTIACTRAYNCTGDRDFLDIAAKHFGIVWDRGWSDDLGGGIWWRTDNNTKNACINCPMTIAACLLGDALDDESYYDKAVQIMDWVVANIYEENTGNVYDAYSIDGNKNHWASTYNQGTFIGANTLLYLHYGDKKYYDRARKAADFTIDKMYQGGVMNNEDNSTDLVGFKGILARWMYCFAMNCGQEDVMDWLEMNGEAAWENRNSDGLTATALATKTPDNVTIIPYSASAAVAVLNNCRGDRDVKLKIADTIDLNDFARCGRMILSGQQGGAKTIETVGENAYLEYTGVRFDEDCRSLQLSLAADRDCTVEIRLDARDGELLAVLEVPAGEEPGTVQAEIEKVTGRHSVYLVIPEEGRKLSY
nr:glycoside hydrolase family 76 protein [uncultured Acetatifactor sp.]